MLSIAVAAPVNAQVVGRSIVDTWRAPASTVIDEEEKDFDDGPVHLSGTLYFPHGMHKVPAVVVFHGASSPTRELPLYRHLKEMLPPLGIAVFVFDRRGNGESSAGKENHNFDLLSDDGVAARRMLAQDPRIDAGRIGYWGLSQGGWLALLAASKDPQAAFAISVSAPISTPDVQMNVAVANILRVNGYGQKEVDQAVGARRAIDDYLRGKVDRAVAQQALNGVRQQPWFKLIYLDDTLDDPATSGWVKQMRLDPMTTLDRVSAPTLMIYGAVDPWTPVALSVERLRATASKHPNIQTAVIANADHTMMLSLDPKSQMDPKSFPAQAPEAPAYFGLMAAWLAQQNLVDLARP